MAGFSKSEAYFVPRALLSLPYHTETYCEMLLPKLAQWREQASAMGGDKSTLCRKFLYDILPYFVEVLVQDGIYLVLEFPNHPVSLLLKVSFRIPSGRILVVLYFVLINFLSRIKFQGMKYGRESLARGF